MRSKLPKILSFVLGAIMLLSGFAKAADMYSFTYLLLFHQAEWAAFLSPLLVLAEITLGILLVLQQYRRLTAILSCVLIAITTAAYAYLYATHYMIDCGCFGALYWLNLSPTLTFVRNALMMATLIYVAWLSDNKVDWRTWRVVLLTATVGIGSFLTAITFRNSAALYFPPTEKEACRVTESPVGEYVHTVSDSTYMVYLFSLDCPKCMNNIGNLLLYKEAGLADTLIGIASGEGNPELHIPLTLDSVSVETLMSICDNIPTTLFIRNDSIVRVHEGSLPAPMFYEAIAQ